MSDSAKNSAANSLIWNFIDKFGKQIIQFGFGVILARILSPNDFGLVGMLTIFLAISNIFIDSGLNSGLIQRKDRTEDDYATVFNFNLLVSVVFYVILFSLAPYIANFYNQTTLKPLIRVLSLVLISNALSIVQQTKLVIELNFKLIAKSNLIGTIIGGISGVIFAYFGFGVWSLVFQNIISSLAITFLLWYIKRWKPYLFFSKNSFRSLFGFSYKLLIAGIYAQIIQNVYNIYIGKTYQASQLGYYNRAQGLTEISSGTVSQTIQQVSYPLMSGFQNDNVKLINIFERIIRLSAFIMFPIMALIAILAKPIVLFILGEKWVEVYPLLQLYVFSKILYPLSAVNLNILNVIGRSDLFLKTDITKSIFIVIVMIISIPLGIKAMIIGQIITSLLSYIINTFLPGRIFNYGLFKQLRLILPIMISTILMIVVCILVINFFEYSLLKIIVVTIFGTCTYLLSTYLLKVKEVEDMKFIYNKVYNKVF